MKRWRTAAVLGALFVGLGGLATWDNWQTKKDEAAEKAKNKLTELKAEDVVELDYASKPEAAAAGETAPADHDDKDENDGAGAEGAVQVAAVKKDGAWRLAKPVDALADGSTVDGLIRTVVDYSSNKEITDQRDRWAEFGLLDPVRTITLRTAGDQPQTLSVYVGNKVPVGYNVYFRTSLDDKVWMGSQHLLVSTGKTLFDFRDKSLVTIDEGKLKSFVYAKVGAAKIELVKTDGKYAITQPEALEADGEAVKEFLSELNLLRVAAFHDQPSPELVQAFKDHWSHELTWSGETGEASTLRVVDRAGKLYAAFDAMQRAFTLPEDFRAKLQKDLTAFRNRRILAAGGVDAQKVTVDGTTYQSVEGNWYLEADAAKAAVADAKDKAPEQAHVRAFMVDLEFAKTDRFIPLTDPQATALTGAPEHRITLSYADAARQPVVIELFKATGEPAEEQYFVRRTDAPFLYRVPKSAFASMTPAPSPKPGEAVIPPEEGDDETMNFEEPVESNGAG